MPKPKSASDSLPKTPNKPKKFTDKQRMDWLEIEAMATNCPKGWQGVVFETGYESELVLLRQAIDTAMRRRAK